LNQKYLFTIIVTNNIVTYFRYITYTRLLAEKIEEDYCNKNVRFCYKKFTLSFWCV